MYEMMIDLETLDTRPSAVVLSIGAVVFNTEMSHPMSGAEGELKAVIVDRFMRVLDIQEQIYRQRTVSQDTLLWWQNQSIAAKAEAFNSVRHPVIQVLNEFQDFAGSNWAPDGKHINAFWASPVAFDLPIWEDLARTFNKDVPWKYNQRYDVRTVVREAGLSVKDHEYTSPGIPHTPVYDCEWQIDLLTAARNKAGRRMAP